jgi:HAE1 family hydrophobic/amphiphilic exporter-1
MTLQTAFFAPLGYSIIFGLSVSTLLTLVVVPTVYSAIESGLARWRRHRATQAAA